MRELPGRVRRAAKGLWKGVKAAPGEAWRVAKAIPGVVKKLLEWLWRVVRRIPAAMKTTCVWVWQSLKRIGKAAGQVFLRILAALNTAVAALLDFFRGITLRDVWNGVCDVFRAVLVDLPRAIWKVIGAAGKAAVMVIVGLFRFSGQLVIWIFQALWYVAKYVPQQLGKIVYEIWTSIAKGYYEIMVLFDPKH